MPRSARVFGTIPAGGWPGALPYVACDMGVCRQRRHSPDRQPLRTRYAMASAPPGLLPGLMALRAGQGLRVLVWFGVVQVIGLGIPAGRQIGGQRTVDESGHGHGVCPAGVPLQCEGH